MEYMLFNRVMYDFKNCHSYYFLQLCKVIENPMHFLVTILNLYANL